MQVWETVLPSSRLKADEIRVWLIDLYEEQKNYASYYSVLDQHEQERANRYKVETKKHQFVITRAIIKKLLAEELGVQNKEIKFRYLQHGKPVLNKQLKNTNIQFNVSHSGQYALVTIGEEIEVGVDVEKIREDVEFDKLAERFFSQQEHEYILSLNEEDKCELFFSIWSAKEAFIKAHGDGVSFGLDKFCVPDPKDNETSVKIDESLHGSWHVNKLPTIQGYKSYLSTNKKDINLSCYMFSV